MSKSKYFQFTGGASTYWGYAIGAFLLTLITFGIGAPWAVCMMQKWKAENTIIGGRQLTFVGRGSHLLDKWFKWSFLTLITCGIYGFWVIPKLNKWIVENTDFAIDPNRAKPKVKIQDTELAA